MTQTIDLKRKVAVVTGGSRGIGRAVSLALAEAGADVVINFVSDERSALETATKAERFGVTARISKNDLADRKQAFELIESTLREFGRIDILVNNAGIWKEAAIDAITEEQLRETISINLEGVFYTTSAAARQMKDQGSGSIILISSTAGQRGEALHSHYAATKGAIISLTKSLAPELAPYNIRVNCVAPGWVATDMTYDSLHSADSESILRLIPMGRVGTPEEIANAVLFLASDLSTFVTGEILNVNGGAVLCG